MARQTDKESTWPRCGDPFDVPLRQLAQTWIAGELSDGDLALEILELQQRVIYMERDVREARRRAPQTLRVAKHEIAVLAQALAEYHSALPPHPTSEDRQITFDVALANCRATENRGRG